MEGYKVIQPLRHNKQFYGVGDFIYADKMNENQACRLLNLHVVEKAIKNEKTEEIVLNVSQLTDALTAPGGDDEPIDEILDLNFNTDELKDGAKDQGLSFANNISKKKLIALIIENNKEQYFLDQLED